MGYDTRFEGYFEITPPVPSTLQNEINKFCRERHNYEDYPSIWCDWIVSESNIIEHNGGEKFYNYTEWITYLIENYFEPNSHKLNGEVRWRGEDFDDIGKIVIENNIVKEKELGDW